MGKNRRKEVRKTFFYIHTNIVSKKWGGKNVRNNFSRNKRLVRAKIVGKKSSEKVRKTFFLNSRKYRDQKIGEQNARDNFFRNTL